MASMTQKTLISGKSMAGASVRVPFTSARAAPRSLVVRALQGPNDAAMKTISAFAAAQLALLPGAAMADVFPTIGAVGAANPAQAFANKSKSVVNKAKGAVASDPIDTLTAKAKAAVNDAKAVAGKNGIPDPAKALQKSAKAASKKVGNPAADFANKGKKAVKQAAPAAKSAVKKTNIPNPAKEFAAKAQQAKNKAKGALGGTPLLTIGMNDLQQQVLFGFGEGKSKVEKAAKAVDENTPSSFSIFDADSVKDVKNKLKKNIDEAVNAPGDPAARVASVGKPGETQEENAERIRREAENGPVTGGDARAPTN